MMKVIRPVARFLLAFHPGATFAATTLLLAQIFCPESSAAGTLPDKQPRALLPSAQHPPLLHSKSKTPPSKNALEEWRHTILHTPRPKKGCFAASFPSTQWKEVPCTQPPPVRLTPASTIGAPHYTVGGQGEDASVKLTSGHIALADGSFDLASGVTSASNQDFTLQLNTQPFHTTVCNSSSLPTCHGVEQFVYHPGTGHIYNQYWIADFGPPGTSCPAPNGTNCASGQVETAGWCPAPIPGTNAVNCVVNGNAGAVPKESLASLAARHLHLSGSSGPNGDEAIFVDDGEAFSASGGNYFPDLSIEWALAEFNVFGWGEGNEVQFEPGVTLIGRTTIEGATADTLACDTRGVTAESNNLDMLGVALAAPSIVFMESNGTGAPIAPPVESISPTQGSNNIAPWPTHLVWPAWPNETAWTIDVDTVDKFNSPDHRTIFGGTLDPLTHSASIDANLLAGKTYYWRVTGNAAHECPRFVHSFSTQAQQPTALAPASQSKDAYPWRMEFSWKVPDGSVSFDWMLNDPHHGNDSYILKQHVDLGDCSLPNCKVVRDVAVNSTVSWSVLAHGPTDLYTPNDGLDAAAEMIRTIAPRPTIVNTKRGDSPSVNPWDIQVDWAKLGGASGYELHVRDGLAGPESPVKTYTATDTHGTDATIAHLDEARVFISVKLYPVGPNISPQVGSSFQDRGDSDDRILFNAGTQTVPCVNKPFNTCDRNNPVLSGHVPYGMPVEFGWTNVQHATGYVVNWYPMATSWNQSLPQPLFALSTVNFNAAQGVTKAPNGYINDVVVIPKEAFSPSLGAHLYGNWISVRAKGPSELDGFQPDYQLSPVARTNGASPYLDSNFAHQNGEGPAYIDIPEVGIDDIAAHMQVDSSGQVLLPVVDGGSAEITMGFGQDPIIYSPEFVQFALFGQHDCTAGGQPFPGATKEFLSPIKSSHWWKTYSLDQSILSYDRDFSFLVATSSIEPNVAPKGKCVNFHSAPSYCGNGVREGTEECDEGQNNGKPESSCSATCMRHQLVCGQPVSNSGGNEGYKGTISLGHANATGRLYYNTLTIPDNIIVYVGGKEIWQSGCVGTEGYIQQPIAGDNTPLGNATIEVQTNCRSPNQDETKWAFEVHCENDQSPGTLAPVEPKH